MSFNGRVLFLLNKKNIYRITKKNNSRKTLMVALLFNTMEENVGWCGD
jgi:hypothetical protein